MSVKMTATLLPLAASVWLLAAVGGAAAFSQIGSEDGESDQKQGIVSVPLPPIPSASGPGSQADTPAPDAAPANAAPVEAPVVPGRADEPMPAVAPAAPAVSPAGAAPEPADAAPAGDALPGPTAAPVVPSDDDAASESAPSNDETPPPAAEIPPAEIFYGDADLPTPVRDLRARLIEICRGGDIEALRPYLQVGEDGTMVSFGGGQEDPIAFLKSASGDGEGVETLAILLEVLEAGHVRNDAGSDGEIFVWPYFTGVPLDRLTPPQKVELFELVTAGDYQEMLGFGAYNFYRAGISPDGKLQFFVAGD